MFLSGGSFLLNEDGTDDDRCFYYQGGSIWDAIRQKSVANQLDN
jgi:hypothetical protein